jgi:hypothetical protein
VIGTRALREIAQFATARQGVPPRETGRDLQFRRPSVIGMNSMTWLVARLAVDLMRTHSATCR